MTRLLRLVARLRGPGGCPWDRKQTLRTLRPQLLEECHEVLDALASRKLSRHAEELGDLLLQVVLHACIRQEQGHFSFADVVNRLIAKLIRRHPHVFGGASARTASEALRTWEAQKAAERTKRSSGSIVEGIPRGLPALARAQRIQARVARIGFDWENAQDVRDKMNEELRELDDAVARRNPRAIREELGDLLFTMVNLSRFHGVEAEDALQSATDKFERRFRQLERRLRVRGREEGHYTLAEMDAEWDRIKRARKNAAGCVTISATRRDSRRAIRASVRCSSRGWQERRSPGAIRFSAAPYRS